MSKDGVEIRCDNVLKVWVHSKYFMRPLLLTIIIFHWNNDSRDMVFLFNHCNGLITFSPPLFLIYFSLFIDSLFFLWNFIFNFFL